MIPLRGATLDGLARAVLERAAEERRHLAHLNAYPGGYDSGTLALAYSDEHGRYKRPSDVRLRFIGPREEAVRLLDEHGFTVDGCRTAIARVEALLEPYPAHDPMTGGMYLAQPSGEGYFGAMLDVLRKILDENDRAAPMTMLGPSMTTEVDGGEDEDEDEPAP